MNQSIYQNAVSLMDEANRQDPNLEMVDGKQWPKELLYSQRMAEMLERYQPDADEVAKLAIRAQHIERWKSPRNAYPMDRSGYLKWRSDLYKFHAEGAIRLMEEAGYDQDSMDRVKKAVSKRGRKINADSQLLEDIAALVFIEYYMQPFVDKHPDYSEEKWIDIILKTWKKMSADAQAFALSGRIELPQALVPLIQKAVADH